MAARLIVIEGIDGAGGEVQSKRLCEFLRKKGIPAERLTFPDYSGPIGRLIHEYLHKKYDFSTKVQFLLYFSDYLKDQAKIKELLKQGKTIVCDRYFTSILAYQEGFPEEKALKIAELFGIQKPDMIIYLRVSPDTSIKRKQGEKAGDLDRNEGNKPLLVKVSRRYEDLIKRQVFCKWVPVDGEKPIEDVFEEIKKALGF